MDEPRDPDVPEKLLNIYEGRESGTSDVLDSSAKINLPTMEHSKPLDNADTPRSTFLGETIKNIDPDLFDKFILASTDKRRFQVVDKWFADISSDCSRPYVGFRGKIISEAERLIKSGLKLSKAGKNTEALEMMGKALLMAPWRTPQTPESHHAYCYGNVHLTRAQLLFQMGRYSECLVDVEQALLHGSRGLRKELVMMRAQVFLNSNRPSEAIDCLVGEAEKYRIADWEVANKARLEKEQADAEAHLGQEGTSKEEKTQLREALRKIREQLAKMEADQKKFEAFLNRAKDEKKRARRKNAQPPKPLIPLWPHSVSVWEEVKKLKLKKGRHPVFPAASVVCELKEDEALGRHFVTKRDLDVGDIVVIEKAFVSCFMEKEPYKHCHACHLYTDVPQPCSTCSVVVFCTPSCATSGRGQLHSRECAFWLSLAFFPYLEESTSMLRTVSTLSLIMATRVILMKTSKEWEEFFKTVEDRMEGEADDPPPVKKRFFSDAYANVFWLKKKASAYSQKELCAVAICARRCMDLLEYAHFDEENKLSEELRDNLGALIIRHMLSFTTNFHAIREVSIKERKTTHLGSMVLPAAHMFRFACCPNLVVVPYADRVVVRATRRIEKGEVLTIYPVGHHDMGFFEDRRAYLLEKFGFTCDCRACVERWPPAHIINNQFLSVKFQVKCIQCRNVVRTTAVSCSKCKAKVGITLGALKEAFKKLHLLHENGFTNTHGNLSPIMPSIRTIAALGLDPFFLKMYSETVVGMWAKLLGNKSP